MGCRLRACDRGAERLRDFFKPLQVPVDRGSVTGRAALEARVVHVPDLIADQEYTWGEAQKIGGYRAALGVPLLREGSVVGVIFVGKVMAQAFTATQIDLVTTFADQAVIAIENVRLFDQVQAANRRAERSTEAADRHRRRSQGDQPLDLRSTDRPRYARAFGGPALRRRYGCDSSSEGDGIHCSRALWLPARLHF